MRVDLAGIGGSALTDSSIAVPEIAGQPGIPVTYVPARNTMLLALALGWAEVLGARDIFIGVNAVDYSGYPDCRPEFIAAFERWRACDQGRGRRRELHGPRAADRSVARRTSFARASRLGVDYG
jgi:7-cyano-7-deazaguanine synthase